MFRRYHCLGMCRSRLWCTSSLLGRAVLTSFDQSRYYLSLPIGIVVIIVFVGAIVYGFVNTHRSREGIVLHSMAAMASVPPVDDGDVSLLRDDCVLFSVEVEGQGGCEQVPAHCPRARARCHNYRLWYCSRWSYFPRGSTGVGIRQHVEDDRFFTGRRNELPRAWERTMDDDDGGWRPRYCN